MQLHVCMWTGHTRTICPSSNDISGYPVGYFNESLNACIPFWNPDKQIEHHRFWLERHQEAHRRQGYFQRCVDEDIAAIREIEANREQIAHDLLIHRARYIHLLTPKERAVIEECNQELRAILGEYQQLELL